MPPWKMVKVMIDIEKTPRLASELAKAYRNNKYEVMDDGRMYFRDSGLFIGGALRDTVNGADECLWPNKVVLEGRRAILFGSLTAGSQYASLYFAPFTGNVTPSDGWKASTFPADSTEFTAYAGDRKIWNKTTHSTAASLGNESSAAEITIDVGQSNIHIRGYGILSAPTKGGTTGILLAAVNVNRPGLEAGDKIGMTYALAAVDAS